jgi:hypothetical protein
VYNSVGRYSDYVDGPHHARRELVENRCLQAGDRVESRMLSSVRSEIYARAPSLVKRVGSGTDHSRKGLDAFELAHLRLRQNPLDSHAQVFIVNRLRETTGEANCRLFEGHDLEAMAAIAGR